MNTLRSTRLTTGFTIVELLIVIVVIAILAAISAVAYSGIQKRSRDSARASDVATLQKAIELYHIDNGGYPTCTAGGVYRAGEPRGNCDTDFSGFISNLSPKYIAKVPIDPTDAGTYKYNYMFGSKKTSDTTYSATSDDNYALFVSYESKGGPYATQRGATTTFNFIAGSSN